MIDEILLLEIMDNQGWTFPLSVPLVLDSKLVNPGKIQGYLRLIQYINQDGKCPCGQDLTDNAELHHALISRNDAVNLPDPGVIHSSFNCIMMHSSCHKRARRATCLAYLVQIFQFSDIRKWYQNVKMNSGGFRNVAALFDDKFLSGQ